MNLTLDHELAHLINDLKWADWTHLYTFAVVLDDNHVVRSAQVVSADADIKTLPQLSGVHAHYWSIGDLCMDLLCGVAHGFSMTRPTGNHRYVLALLEAIRQHETT